jgi:hypothetical protein
MVMLLLLYVWLIWFGFDCGEKIMLDEMRGDCQGASDGTDGRTGIPRRTNENEN